MNKLEEVVNVTTNKNNYISLKNDIKNKINTPNSIENKIFTQSGLNQNDFAEKFIIYLERNFINNDSIQQSQTNGLSGKIEFTLNKDIPTEQYNNFLNSLNNKQQTQEQPNNQSSKQTQNMIPKQSGNTQELEDKLSKIFGDNWEKYKNGIQNWVNSNEKELIESLSTNYLKSLYGRITEEVSAKSLLVNYVSQLLIDKGLSPNNNKIITKINGDNEIKNLSNKIDYTITQSEEEKNYEGILGFTPDDVSVVKENLIEFLNNLKFREIVTNTLKTYGITLESVAVDPDNQCKGNTIKKRIKTKNEGEGVFEVDKVIEVINAFTYPIVIDIESNNNRKALKVALLDIRKQIAKKLEFKHRDYINTVYQGNTFYKKSSPIKKYYDIEIGKKAVISDNLDSMYFTINTVISSNQIEDNLKNFILGKSTAGKAFKTITKSLPKTNAWTAGMLS